ncbi:MAG: methionine--tRNA ligase subunit beta [Candidatus Pacebacteria bacterium]|nr:methionine--tRNA ligase subunit beta [Candidatus Paceibacterota bacterium]
MINFDDFKKVDLRVGRVVQAEKVEKSDKLLKLMIDIGEEEERQVLSGIARSYNPEDLIDKNIILVANLEPRSIMGFESRGMVLAVGSENGIVLISPEKETDSGLQVT